MKEFLPYGRQEIDGRDHEVVRQALDSDWLTTGPKVEEFEQAVAEFAGGNHAVAVSSGTAALHAAMFALDIGPGDEVLVPALTFAATANCVLYQGGTPVFCDVDADTLLLDAAAVESKITAKTKAVLAVDYAGQACDYQSLRRVAERHGLALVADSSHALGARSRGRPVAQQVDLATYSFHPVKHITTAEGGMLVTSRENWAQRARLFRNHGLDADHRARQDLGTWEYDMVALGFNYRLSDLQCALGLAQLQRLPKWLQRRREIAARYDASWPADCGIRPLGCLAENTHAYHLYVVQVEGKAPESLRASMFEALRREAIGVNVHYKPVYLHTYYRERLGLAPGSCPRAESAYQKLLSLPMYPSLRDEDVDRVVESVLRCHKQATS